MIRRKLKKNEPDPLEIKLEKWFKWLWNEVILVGLKFVKREYKRYMEWYFFYKADSKGDKALHIIGVLVADLFILRFFGVI
ncbi:hypothetical protein M0R04_10300 [Candidatus Dojkabacteria bacterium]|jgi:hypothetical protein|nr:hypothetical protein [Candidatus Dojkabacteria bacterium]